MANKGGGFGGFGQGYSGFGRGFGGFGQGFDFGNPNIASFSGKGGGWTPPVPVLQNPPQPIS